MLRPLAEARSSQSLPSACGPSQPLEAGLGIANPAGESLLPLAQKGQPRKKDYVVSEYHSVFSGTGMFMVRQAEMKLVMFAPVHNVSWPPQLFNLTADPWEHKNLAQDSPALVSRLSALLDAEYNMAKADADKKAFDKVMFEKYWYNKHGASGCIKSMGQVYEGFSPSDAPLVAQWLGKPCN